MSQIIATTVATLLLSSCTHAGAQTVEADNGAVYHITDIAHTRGGSAVAAIKPANGDPPMDIQFECRGHMIIYSYGAQAFGPSESVAPRSVAGKIEQVACRKPTS